MRSVGVLTLANLKIFGAGAALRDWEMIMQYIATVDRDPFRLSTRNLLSRDLMYEAGLLSDELNRTHLGVHDIPLDWGKPDLSGLPGESRHARLGWEKAWELLTRFLLAVSCGVSLIAPVIFMVLYDSLLARLLITAASVVLFAFVVAMISGGMVEWARTLEFSVADVVGATLAYAAIPVVFIRGVSS